MNYSDLRKLGAALYFLQEVSKKEFKGEKIDLNLKGTYKEIKSKFRKLSRKFHPDMFGSNRY